ncbi:MAG: disulfide bond formation protein B [Litorimonas sp.]
MTPLFRIPDARAALFAGGLSLALLCGAWVFQYGLGYAPCIMCYWQRYAHMAVVGVAVAVILARAAFGEGKGLPRWLGPAILILLLLGSAGLGGYHVGVEMGIFEGPRACAAGPVGASIVVDPTDPLAALDGPIKPPACSDVAWALLGVSMAGWNLIFSALGALGTWTLGFGGRS